MNRYLAYNTVIVHNWAISYVQNDSTTTMLSYFHTRFLMQEHYENTFIQIYRKFHLQKLIFFSDKNSARLF